MENHEIEKIELIKKAFEFKSQKKYRKAIETLYKVLEYQNNDNDSIEILYQLGELYLLLENYDRALDQFQKALSINTNDQDCNQKCFEIYFKTNQFNKALKIATKMCENIKSAKSYYNYIKTLIATDKKQDAIEFFNKLNEPIKLDTDILYLISTISENKKEIMLKRILELDMYHPKANVEMAKIEYERGNFDKAIPYCINADEDNAEALYYLGKIESARKNYSKAVEHYIKAIELDKDEHDFYLDLAKSYIDVSWLDEALIALRKSINMAIVKNNNENIDEKHFLSGWILIKKNEPSKALLSLNLIKKDSKLYPNAQILIQVINLKNSNLAKAIKKLEEYFKTEKENGILLDTLALCYKELKLYKKAIEIYKQGLKIYPNSIYYTLELIDLLIDNKNYDEAMKLIEEFSSEHKNCASIYNSLARIYYRLNDLNKAYEAIKEYIKLDKNNSESYYFQGLILNDMNNFDEAKTSIYNAININPLIAKYYSQMARSYKGLNEYENALIYAREAIEIDQSEINYKKQAYDISLLIGNEEQIKHFKKQLERSEKFLKLRKWFWVKKREVIKTPISPLKLFNNKPKVFQLSLYLYFKLLFSSLQIKQPNIILQMSYRLIII